MVIVARVEVRRVLRAAGNAVSVAVLKAILQNVSRALTSSFA